MRRDLKIGEILDRVEMISFEAKETGNELLIKQVDELLNLMREQYKISNELRDSFYSLASRL